jgi:hypothetical protein
MQKARRVLSPMSLFPRLNDFRPSKPSVSMQQIAMRRCRSDAIRHRHKREKNKVWSGRAGLGLTRINNNNLLSHCRARELKSITPCVLQRTRVMRRGLGNLDTFFLGHCLCMKFLLEPKCDCLFYTFKRICKKLYLYPRLHIF